MTNFKARPTVYKGVAMRSRLEAGFAQWLDTRGVEWEYEPCAFGSDAGQYLPDFRIKDIPVRQGDPGDLYVEVKPRAPDLGTIHELVWGQPDLPGLAGLGRRMAVIWESEPEAELALLWPGLNLDTGAPGAMILRRLADEESTDFPTVWLPTAWAQAGPRGLALADSLMAHQGPWPDGYWNVQ